MTFSDAKNLGGVVMPCQYRCFAHSPHTVRKPDVSFVARQRWPKGDMAEPFCRVVPDLIAEVVAPDDRFNDVDERITDYLTAGVRVVWLVNPSNGTVLLFRPKSNSIYRLRRNHLLEGDDVLSGFRCRVADIFAPCYACRGDEL